MPAPLLLADLDLHQLFWLAIIVISFLSWVVKQLKGGDAAVQPQRRPPADKPLRSEIEVFLKELTKGEQEPPRKPAPPPPRKQPASAKAKPEKPRKARPGTPPSKPVSNPPKRGSRLSEQHLPTTQLGQGVRAHLTGYMASDRVTAEAQEFIGHRIEDAVQSDLGQSGMTLPLGSRTPHPLLALMSQPGGMRQALVLNEILQKPAALRRKTS
jgi:hypothetical protein